LLCNAEARWACYLGDNLGTLRGNAVVLGADNRAAEMAAHQLGSQPLTNLDGNLPAVLALQLAMDNLILKGGYLGVASALLST
tara:strand:+ start:1537 stop:1785 length:249 start_codon:yes stop_codon:yes gene_type:complete